MKRKKLIAALTAAVMAVAMLPSIAMAAPLEEGSSGYFGVGPYESTVQVLPHVSDANISKNVVVNTEKVGNATTAKFTTLNGKKLPYIEGCRLFTDYVENHNNYATDYPEDKDLDDLALANGNYVKCRIILGNEFVTEDTAGNDQFGSIESVNHPAQSRNTLTTEVRDYGSGEATEAEAEITDGGALDISTEDVCVLDLTLWVPASGSETFKITYPKGKGTSIRTETLKLDFSGIARETADESDVNVTLVEPTAVDATFPKLNTDGMGNFVNRNVVADYNLNAHLLTLTNNGEGYVPYKTGFRNFSKDNVAAQEGNYVAFTFTVGDAWVPDKNSQFVVEDWTNYPSKLVIEPNSYPTDFYEGGVSAAAGSQQVSVMKLVDAATLDQKVGKYEVINGYPEGSGMRESETILVDYSKLNLVNKKEAGDAAAAASLIESTIPSATNASKQAVETAKNAYDALTPGGKAQLQMMHTEAYDTLMAAEKALTDDTSSTTKPTNTSTTSTTSDVVKEGTTVKVKDATYKVTGSKTVTYKKAPKNKKNVKVPASVTIKGKSYKVTAIANNAFKGNKKVKTVTVGKNVKTIGSSAFQNCKALTKVTLPAKTTTIKKNAFANSKKLKTVVVKSKKMTKSTVKANAFKKTSKKATFNVPNNKVKAYTKLFRQKGLPKACKIK